MASLEEQIMDQPSSEQYQRFFSAVQEILEELERTLALERENQGIGLDVPSTISAALQLCITLADGNQPKTPPGTQEAHLSPTEEFVLRTSSDSAQDQFLEETEQERTDNQQERDGEKTGFESYSDDSNKNLVEMGEQPSRNLKNKEEVTQSREWPHCCNVCGKGFTHKAHLRIHERIHTGDRPYHCDVCDKSFTQTSHLKPHEPTHTGERPYSCNVCKKSFITGSSLKTHEYIRTREKPYTCDTCGKGFCQKYTLTMHKRTHTGEKPYLCDVCGKAFSHSRCLKHHKCAWRGMVLC